MKISKQSKTRSQATVPLVPGERLARRGPRPAGRATGLIAAGRRNCPAILAHFLRLVRLDRAGTRPTSRAPRRLPADLQAAITGRPDAPVRPGLTTAFSHRPALIGGMRIQVGSDVYDGSVRAGLAALEKSF